MEHGPVLVTCRGMSSEPVTRDVLGLMDSTRWLLRLGRSSGVILGFLAMSCARLLPWGGGYWGFTGESINWLGWACDLKESEEDRVKDFSDNGV